MTLDTQTLPARCDIELFANFVDEHLAVTTALWCEVHVMPSTTTSHRCADFATHRCDALASTSHRLTKKIFFVSDLLAAMYA